METQAESKRVVLEKRVELGDFLSKLIQSLLRIGYYDPAHPESSKIKTGLSEKFNHFFANRYDLTFVVQQTETGKEILLMGIVDEPLRMHDLIPGANAGVFSSKITEFMGRKNLVSLTLKKEITEEEFIAFMEILSHTSMDDIKELHESMDHFTHSLSEKSITHVSYLFDQDVVGADRNLHWQVWLTISRFKKDITIIPILRKMAPEEFLNIRKQLIKEIIRPIVRPSLLAEFIMNADLLAGEQISLDEIEPEIIDNIPESLISEVCLEILRQNGDNAEGASLSQGSRARSIIKRLCFRIPEHDDGEKTGALLKSLYEGQIIGLEELPKHLQLRFKIEKILAKFLGAAESCIQHFNNTQTPDVYDQYRQIFKAITPDLVKMERYKELQLILDALNNHRAEGTVRSEWAAEALKEIGARITALGFQQAYIAADKPKRMEINRILVALGNPGKEILLEVITSSRDQWVLKNACDALVPFGPDALDSLVLKFKEGAIPESLLKTILAACVDIAKEIDAPSFSQELLDFMKGCLIHSDPRVQEEALTLVGQLGCSQADVEVIEALKHKDDRVRRRAVWCVRMTKSPNAVPALLDILMMDNGTEAMEALQKDVCQTLGALGNVKLGGNRDLEEALFTALRRHRGNVLTRFFRMRFGRSRGIVAAICATLGAVGTSKSLGLLEQMVRTKLDTVREEAERALNAIKERQQVPATGS
ncbi:MAG: HEAT repeat domain-containing protein [bacterium]